MLKLPKRGGNGASQREREGGGERGSSEASLGDSSRLIPQMESLLARRVRDSYFENLGIGRKKCLKVQKLALVCQMKFFTLDEGR